MYWTLSVLVLITGLAGAADVAANDPVPAGVGDVERPRFPTPMQTSILGLSVTAIAVIGARASNRNSDTMMFMVLASVAVTALMVVVSDKTHRAYEQARRAVHEARLIPPPTGPS